MSARGLGGVAANEHVVLVGDRDLGDLMDVFRCHAADTGAILWTFRQPAPGKLDYGNTPRATPVIVGERVILFGALGHLACVDRKSGLPHWQVHLPTEFGTPEKSMPWGYCGTPLVVDDKVIVAPGVPEASVVALDLKTGGVVWKCPGAAPSYGSFILALLGGKRQIVGHDADSLGGWDPATGQRLWRLVPPRANDYNVPTPMVWQDHLVVATENNGTRLYRFNHDGTIVPEPVAVHRDLAPDTHSPVLVGNRVFGIWNGLHCLDLARKLHAAPILEDNSFMEYAALIASEHRLLCFGHDAEWLLIDIRGPEPRLVQKLEPTPEERGLYAHPALVGRRIYLRGNEHLYAFELPK